MTVKMKIAQPQAFKARMTTAMSESRARSAGRSAWARGLATDVRVAGFATELSTGHPPRDARRSGGTALPPRTPALGGVVGSGPAEVRQQATGLIPDRGFTVAGQRRVLTGFAAAAPSRRAAATWQP